jgi:peptidoglycan/LPS O-acetylase OafA/YrhL
MPSSRSPHHLPSLDGLRAVSFLSIFMGHAGLRHCAALGNPALAVFFVLSGYLITTLLRQEYERNGTILLKIFYARRALRLLPPLLLVLIIAVCFAWSVYPPGTVQTGPVVATAMNVTNYWIVLFGGPGMAPGTERYWSLAVEEHFYLLYPLLYLLLRRAGLSGAQQARVLWGLCGLALLWRCILVRFDLVPTNYIGLASETRGDMLLFGCALAAWANPALDTTRLPEHIWKWLIVPICIAAMSASILWNNLHFHLTWYFSLQGLALSGLLPAAVRYPQWLLFRWLNWRPIAFVGIISYTLYLIHDVALRAASQLWPHQPLAIRAAIALVASVLVALMMYLLVERPCARLRARLHHRRVESVNTTRAYAGG